MIAINVSIVELHVVHSCKGNMQMLPNSGRESLQSGSVAAAGLQNRPSIYKEFK